MEPPIVQKTVTSNAAVTKRQDAEPLRAHTHRKWFRSVEARLLRTRDFGVYSPRKTAWFSSIALC